MEFIVKGYQTGAGSFELRIVANSASDALAAAVAAGRCKEYEVSVVVPA